MPRKDIPIEEKVRIVEAFQAGKLRAAQACAEAGIGQTTLKRWASLYKTQGIDGLLPAPGQRHFSNEMKMAAVQDYLQGGLTYNEICERYKLRSCHQIWSWVKIYKDKGEFREPKPKVSGFTKRRKVGFEERVAIAKACIEAGNDYGGTALKYQVAYAQVLEWTGKYRAGGEEALRDHRGHNGYTQATAYISAAMLTTRLSLRYKVDRAWLWGLLADEYNITRGSGYVMSPVEVRKFEYSVIAALERTGARQPD